MGDMGNVRVITTKMRIAAGFLILAAAGAAQATDTAPVRVYDAGELSLDRYTVVKRLWTGSLRASFWIPEYDDAAAGISAITSEAARVGADGVINLHCMQDKAGWGGGYLCYALAIKLK